MKVWICVIGHDYEGFNIIKVVSTKEKAKAWQDENDSLIELGMVSGDYTDIYEETVDAD